MTRFVEQARHPQRIRLRLALGALTLILALATVWLPSGEGTALLLLKGGCTLALWCLVLTELAVCTRVVRLARTAERRAGDTMRVLTEALDVIPQAVAIFDSTDRPILVNQRFSELHGSSPLTGAGTRPGEAGNAIADPTGESERPLPDGRWVRIDGHRTRNGYRVMVSSDVTELKRQKAELIRRSRLLETTLNAADRGICIWAADGRLAMSNVQVAALLDLPAELVATGCPFEKFEAFLSSRGEAALGGVAGTAADPVVKASRAAIRYEHIRSDGRVLDVLCAALPDGGRVVSYGDITAIRRVERDLCEGEERFRRLASATTEGVLVHDGDAIIDANDAALTLLDRKLTDLLGRSAERLIVPADFRALRIAFACKKEEQREAWFLRPDGSRLLCEVSQRIVPYRGGNAGVMTLHDITGYRRIEEQLRAAREKEEAKSRTRSDLLDHLGQGLRSPAGDILSALRHIPESQHLTDGQQSRLQTVQSSIADLIGALGDIMDLARLEGGRQRMDDDDFDLIDLVEDVAGPLAAQAAAKGIDLVSSVAADVPHTVRGDAGRLRQVLATLVGNAVKYTGQGGITLSTTVSPIAKGANAGTMPCCASRW